VWRICCLWWLAGVTVTPQVNNPWHNRLGIPDGRIPGRARFLLAGMLAHDAGVVKEILGNRHRGTQYLFRSVQRPVGGGRCMRRNSLLA